MEQIGGWLLGTHQGAVSREHLDATVAVNMGEEVKIVKAQFEQHQAAFDPRADPAQDSPHSFGEILQ